MKRQLTVIRNGKIIWICLDPWYVPRKWESLSVENNDTVYIVTNVHSILNDIETQHVVVEVKIGEEEEVPDYVYKLEKRMTGWNTPRW